MREQEWLCLTYQAVSLVILDFYDVYSDPVFLAYYRRRLLGSFRLPVCRKVAVKQQHYILSLIWFIELFKAEASDR